MIINHEEQWPIDGKDHKNIDYESLYHNDLIDSFFVTDRTILIAAKGMGKTLLLRSKKYLLENSEEGHLTIPRNQEADYPQLHGDYSAKGLVKVGLWRDLWIISIILSVMSHRFILSGDQLQDEPLWDYIEGLDASSKVKEMISSDIMGESSNPPSHYVSMLLNIGLGSLQKLLKSAFQIDGINRHYIQSSVCVFIDAFDQALTACFPHNLEVWKNAQIGLIHAVYRLHHNKHLKVFISIRQEAWSAFKADDREAIKGQSVILTYTKNALKQMFEHAIRKYSKYKSIEAFTGLEKIGNGWCNEQENIFDYIYRHSSGSPRSIMSFGSDIHRLNINNINEHDRPNEFRLVVNETGADQVYKDYLISQRRMFLNTLFDEKNVKELLSLIPSNVLKGNVLATINAKYASVHNVDPKESHPFCELYNVGVIGIVTENHATGKQEQVFKQPHQFDWKQCELLHDNRIYLVHPSLYNKITSLRGERYHLNTSNIIGNGGEWKEPFNGKLFPLIFISHSSDDKEKVEPIMTQIDKELCLLRPCDMWYDKHQITAGQNIHEAVEIGIESSDLVLVFISKSSIESGWVNKEWRDKHCEEINNGTVKVICCLLDDTDFSQIPLALRNKKVQFFNDDKKINLEITQLVKDISELL